MRNNNPVNYVAFDYCYHCCCLAQIRRHQPQGSKSQVSGTGTIHAISDGQVADMDALTSGSQGLTSTIITANMIGR